MGGTVVLDSSNVDSVIADALGTAEAASEAPAPMPAEPVKAEKVDAEGDSEESHEQEHDFAAELGVSKEVHEKFTQIIKREVGKKNRQRRDAEEFATEQYNARMLAENRARELERELNRMKALPARPEPEKPQDEQKPDRKNFETDEAYQEALVAFRVGQELAKERQKAAQEAETRRMQEIASAAAARVQHASEIVEDFSEILEKADYNVPPHIAGYMQESEMIAELGYHFAKHPEVLEKLSQMTPGRSLVELGKIESTLKPFAKSEKTPVKATPDGSQPSSQTGNPPSRPRAPAPIRPLTSSAPQVEKPEDQMSYPEAYRAWQKRRGVNLSKRQRH